jgi:hypothetical protein
VRGARGVKRTVRHDGWQTNVGSGTDACRAVRGMKREERQQWITEGHWSFCSSSRHSTSRYKIGGILTGGLRTTMECTKKEKRRKKKNKK